MKARNSWLIALYPGVELLSIDDLSRVVDIS